MLRQNCPGSKMRQTMSKLLVLSALLVLTATVPTIAQSEIRGDLGCPPGVLSVSFDAPPAGMANYSTVHLDEDCRPIVGPVRTVPVDQLPAIALDPLARQAVFEPVVEGKEGSPRWNTTYHAEQAVLDIVNITLNKLYSTINFTYDGSIIHSFSAGGGALSHRENRPPSCGKGWKLKRQSNAQITGGVSLSSVGFLQTGEFRYRGFFDCSGSIYYNTLKNYPTVYGNGTGTCHFTQQYRTWSLLWYWAMACY